MLKKLYPVEQMEKYLLIDVIAICFFVYQIVLKSDGVPLALRLLVVAGFLACFYVGLWQRDWRLLAACVLGCLLLSAAASRMADWLLLYGFVFADLLGRAERKWMIAAGMAGIAAMFVLFSWQAEGDPLAFAVTFYFPMMLVQLAMPLLVQARSRAKQLQQELDAANSRIARYIQEEERNRIARDLHDTLGQTLTMIKLKSELALRMVDMNAERARQELGDIVHSSRYALKQVRELVSDMKFVPLDKELEQAEETLHRAGIGLQLEKPPADDPLPLSTTAETFAALSLREAVTNIIKHSGAARCSIVLQREAESGKAVLRIRDDGSGRVAPGTGNGLQSIKERMAMINGDAHIAGRPGEGTEIVLHIPLQKDDAKEERR